jgi:hypothetical protein
MAALLYGFHQLADLLSTQAVEVDRNLLMSAINMSTAQHNQQINELLSLFSEDTAQYKVKFQSAVSTKNQPLDEFGRSRPIKLGLPYETAFPIFTSGNAWGADFIALQKMTVQQLNDLTSTMLLGDARYNRDCVLAALFNSTNGGRAFQDPQYGALSVQGLANGDTVKYVLANTDAPATDSHYLFQAADIADATNVFATVYTELMEHPENAGGTIVTFIASDLVEDAEALATFVAVGDPNIAKGANADTIVGSLGVQLPGTAVLRGRTNNQWIVEWPSLPSGYGISLVVGVSEPVLRRRQDPEAQLQGFRPQGERQDFPYFEQQWFRRCGFGAWNRVRAACFLIGAGAWAIPAGYDTFEP